MKKKFLKQLFEGNGYKVLKIYIYADGFQADVVVENTCLGQKEFKQFVINKTDLYNECNGKITATYLVFGVNEYLYTELRTGVSND